MAFTALGGTLIRGGREDACGATRADDTGARSGFSTAEAARAGALADGLTLAISTGGAIAAATAGGALGLRRSAKNAAPIPSSAAATMSGARRLVEADGATQPRVVVARS